MMTMATTPDYSKDVLCGKDRTSLQARGSQLFRTIIDSYVAKYNSCACKYDKMSITREIYEVVTQTHMARFLKYNDSEECWNELTPMQARDKVGHALRFASKKRTTRKHKRAASFSSTSSTETGSSTSSDGASPHAPMKRQKAESCCVASSESTEAEAPMPSLPALPFQAPLFQSVEDSTLMDQVYSQLNNGNALDVDPTLDDEMLQLLQTIDLEPTFIPSSCANSGSEDVLLDLLNSPIIDW